jgi:hypothetical protein
MNKPRGQGDHKEVLQERLPVDGGFFEWKKEGRTSSALTPASRIDVN